MRIFLFAIVCISSWVTVLNSPLNIPFPFCVKFSKAEDISLIQKVENFNSMKKTNPYKKRSKTNVLVLCSRGGYGHIAAYKTLQQILPSNYSMTVVYPIEEVKMYGLPSNEGFYNKLLKLGWYQLTNFCSKYLAPWVLRQRYDKIEETISQHIERVNADIIISLIPMVNFPATEAARKKDIPYLLVTTDNDLSNWVLDLDKVKHPSFEITTATDLSLTKNLLLSKDIAPEKIHSVGLPIRVDFLEKKNKKNIRKEFALSNKPTVLLMMGGNGSNLAYQYAKILAEQELFIQLIVIAGRNEDLLQRINGIVPHPSNSLCSIGFTEKVSDLMAVSDLLISKPGPGTIAEAIQMKIPVLLDTNSASLYWEKINLEIILKHGIGGIIESKEKICEQVQQYLNNSEVRKDVKRAFQKVPANTFDDDIEKILAKFLQNDFSEKVKQRKNR